MKTATSVFWCLVLTGKCYQSSIACRLHTLATVALQTPANLVHVVLEGGFPPATAGNPRPYGMPPFATVLSNDEVAQLLSHLRGSWGNRGAPVSALDVVKFRSGRQRTRAVGRLCDEEQGHGAQ